MKPVEFADLPVPVNQVLAFRKAVLFPERISLFVIAQDHERDLLNAFLMKRPQHVVQEFPADALALMILLHRQVVNQGTSPVVTGKDCADDPPVLHGDKARVGISPEIFRDYCAT